MASEKQIAANRANAQKSTGPRTAEGKLVSSRNAVGHGLTGRVPFLTESDQLLYAELGQRLALENQPIGAIEEELLKTIQDCHWQLDRLRILGQQTIARLLNGAPTAAGDPAENPAPPTLTLDQLGRYETRLQRSLLGSIHELRRCQKERHHKEHKDRIWRFEEDNRRPFNPKYDRVRAPNGFVLEDDLRFPGYVAAALQLLARRSAENAAADPNHTSGTPEPVAPAA